MTSVCEAILAKQQGVGRVVNDAKPEKPQTKSFFRSEGLTVKNALILLVHPEGLEPPTF